MNSKTYIIWTQTVDNGWTSNALVETTACLVSAKNDEPWRRTRMAALSATREQRRKRVAFLQK